VNETWNQRRWKCAEMVRNAFLVKDLVMERRSSKFWKINCSEILCFTKYAQVLKIIADGKRNFTSNIFLLLYFIYSSYETVRSFMTRPIRAAEKRFLPVKRFYNLDVERRVDHWFYDAKLSRSCSWEQNSKKIATGIKFNLLQNTSLLNNQNGKSIKFQEKFLSKRTKFSVIKSSKNDNFKSILIEKKNVHYVGRQAILIPVIKSLESLLTCNFIIVYYHILELSASSQKINYFTKQKFKIFWK